MSAPPRLAEWLLSASIPAARTRDGILGDLAEEYDDLAGRLGDGAARRWYWTEAVRLTAWLVWARLGPANGDRRRGRRAWWASDRMADQSRGRLSPLRDLRFACRALRHQPVLSATIVITLAAALAANATIFAIGDALVLRPFRFPGVERAVVISSTGHERFFARESVAPGDFLDWRERTRDVFEQLAAIEWWDVNASGDGVPEQVPGFRVTADLFTVLDARAVLGRFWRSPTSAPARCPW